MTGAGALSRYREISRYRHDIGFPTFRPHNRLSPDRCALLAAVLCFCISNVFHFDRARVRADQAPQDGEDPLQDCPREEGCEGRCAREDREGPRHEEGEATSSRLRDRLA